MPRPPSMTRRTVLGAAGLAVLAAGCDSTAKPRTAARSTPPAEVDPDIQAAANVLDNIAYLRGIVDATRAKHPELRPLLAPLSRMHQAHVDALAGAVPKGVKVSTPVRPAPPPVPARRKVALHRLRLAEAALAREVATSAEHAESGAFARLLASMSVAVDQRLAGWPS